MSRTIVVDNLKRIVDVSGFKPWFWTRQFGARLIHLRFRQFTNTILHSHRGVHLISDALPFGKLWYAEPDAISNAIGYAKFRSRSHDAVIRVFDVTGNVTETHEHAGDF